MMRMHEIRAFELQIKRNISLAVIHKHYWYSSSSKNGLEIQACMGLYFRSERDSKPATHCTVITEVKARVR